MGPRAGNADKPPGRARGLKPERPDIRQQILRFLKTRGQSEVRDVARHFRISHEGARKQLVRMEAGGLVTRTPEVGQEAAGRPKDFYTVTAAGDQSFPKAYDRLSMAILEGLRRESGGKGAGRILSALAQAQVEAWAPKLEGKTLKEKLDALKGLYMEADPFATVESRDGDFLLIERNCPFLNVAMEHPALCSLSVSTLEMLLGCRVVREERFQAGNGRCVFRVKLDAPIAKREFRFESDPS
ncbi:MAG: putative transcriptional regulator [Fibrobacteres bacterium]|nr:putative transcriptional regulator [Fibrobacterota bacterium]